MVAVIGKGLMFQGTCFHWQMDEKIGLSWTVYTMKLCTVRNTRNIPGCIFPCFWCFLARKTSKMHFACLCAPHDITYVKTMPASIRAHPQLYCVKLWSQSNQWFWRYSHFCILTPCSCSHPLPECLPLPPHLLHLICHTWPTKCQYLYHSLHTTGLPVTRCKSFAYSSASLRPGPKFAGIKAEEKLDYLLCILCKEGYAAMDRWVPADEAHKNDLTKFLDYVESMLDDKISPWVHVYELEDITKRSDESINELVGQICQLTCRAQIGNGSDAAIEFKVQWRLIWGIPDADIELCKQLPKVSCDKRVSHPLEICRTYYAVEAGTTAMCVGHVVHAVCHTHQAHDSKPQTSYAPCPNYTHQHPPSRHNCPAQDSACNGCGEKGHWWAKCHSSNITSPQAPLHQPWFKGHEKGRESQAAKAKTEKRPLHKDLFVAVMHCGTVGDMHPKEMIIDNISSQRCNEMYTVIKLPASASSKGTTSVQMACPLAWTLFEPSQLPTMGLQFPCMKSCMAPSSGNQTLLEPNHAWSTHTGMLQTHLVLPSWVS